MDGFAAFTVPKVLHRSVGNSCYHYWSLHFRLDNSVKTKNQSEKEKVISLQGRHKMICRCNDGMQFQSERKRRQYFKIKVTSPPFLLRNKVTNENQLWERDYLGVFTRDSGLIKSATGLWCVFQNEGKLIGVCGIFHKGMSIKSYVIIIYFSILISIYCGFGSIMIKSTNISFL